MASIQFEIDGQSYTFEAPNHQSFETGEDEVLSTPSTDLTSGQAWYEQGFQTFKILDDSEFGSLVSGLTECVRRILEEELRVDTDAFSLQHYHKWVRSSDDHMKVASRTRDLFPKDFNFPINDLISKFEAFLGFRLTDFDPATGDPLHVILRINRPDSNDFNPPHKDAYEVVDGEASLSPFINMWIPICGVTERSSLPIAPSSHLYRETQILRTRKGGEFGGNQYRVRLVKNWDGSNQLVRTNVRPGEVLCFSPFLVHGLAINEEFDSTRVSLEFRLFRQG